MSRSLTLLTVTVALALPSLPATAQTKTANRYLADDGVDLATILPSAPTRGSARDDADRRTFRETRKIFGTARWAEATSDAREDIASILTDFSPAADRPLTPSHYPVLAALLGKMRPDISSAVNRAKDSWRRERPFLIDRGPICQPRAELEHSFDYPSGHTTWGTSVALVLVELIPDRATQILERGRAYGDSRSICGAHNLSAVEAGRLAAASIVARLHGDVAFRRDLDAARAELAGRK